MKATNEQIERIRLEAWTADELAARADVPRTLAVEWLKRDLVTMPYAQASVLCLQAEGLLPMPSTGRDYLHRRAARRVRAWTA